jgi:hypothetical protein
VRHVRAPVHLGGGFVELGDGVERHHAPQLLGEQTEQVSIDRLGNESHRRA